MPPRYFVTLLLVCSSLLFVRILNLFFRLEVQKTRHPEIEGLRGLLAWFVMLHHLCIWYFYLKYSRWEPPPFNLFSHFGNGAVAFFFMITAFLFTRKLMKGVNAGWRPFFVNRFLRLFPVYAFSVLLLFALVMYLSGMRVQVSAGRLTDQFLHWIGFTYLGAPDMNGYKNTYLLNAGVAWSLRYEIMFYALVPFLGLLFKERAGWITLSSCLVLILLFFLKTAAVNSLLLLYFLAGILTAIGYGKLKNIRIIKSGWAAIICCLLLFTGVVCCPSADNLLSVCLFSLVFGAIAGGNNLGGLLVARSTQVLGQLSYSIYLLHGMVLFCVNQSRFGGKLPAGLGFEQYLLTGLTPAFLTVLLSFAAHKFIERPFMEWRVKMEISE
ncbi:MAG: acyltransferase [Ferruginibacter sp.]